MKREHLAFLFGGFAFGILVGYGLFHAVDSRPLQESAFAAAEAPGPKGPMAPTADGGRSAAPTDAPMVAMINELKRQLESDPQNQELLIRLAQIYDRVRMTDQALVFYERAADLSPRDVDLSIRVANLHHDAQRWEQAVRYYERALEVVPGDPNLLTDLGTCYRGIGDFDKALDVFDRAHALDPAHWQSLFNKVVVAAFDLRRFDLARATMASLDALEPRPADLEQRLQQLREAVEREAAAKPGGEGRS